MLFRAKCYETHRDSKTKETHRYESSSCYIQAPTLEKAEELAKEFFVDNWDFDVRPVSQDYCGVL